jgi:hypothetical protein
MLRRIMRVQGQRTDKIRNDSYPSSFKAELQRLNLAKPRAI